MMYVSTKEYKQIAPVSYRQWRADSHCNDIHGYAMSFKFFFAATDLDARNWVMDYGGLRPLKDKLEEWFDHKMLVAEDDPDMDKFKQIEAWGLAKLTIVEATGCEGLSRWLLRYVNEIFLPSYGADVAERVTCMKVEVRETDANMAFAIWEAGIDGLDDQ